MEQEKSVAPVPEQQTGKSTQNKSELNARDEEQAAQFFHMAADRLADVNRWEEWCGAVSASFKLTDENGQSLSRKVQEGDFIRIDIPGPGSKAGDGCDWVRVEKVESSHIAENDEELVSILVRPAVSPTNDSSDTAHFFEDSATSTFLVRRKGKTISAEIYGRNERPNTNTEKTTDKLRNKVVAETAAIAFSDLQWKSLAEGLLKQA